MAKTSIPKGDKDREAIDALKGYVYQIYQSALAWIELKPDERLFLEVAEDYAVVSRNVLKGVQVKETAKSVTINSEDIITSIDSFISLRKNNPTLKVELHHLTTSKIGKEKFKSHRIGNTPTLIMWRKLAKVGDLKPLRRILATSKISKDYICELDDVDFREEFLKRIFFDCGALETTYLLPQLRSELLQLLLERGGNNAQLEGCLNSILIHLLRKATQKEERSVDRNELEDLLEKATQVTINRAQFEILTQRLSYALEAFASGSQTADLVTKRLAKPKLINEVPLPAAIANRTVLIDNIEFSLTQYGVSWIFGAAGVGKTLGAKIVAQRLEGNWAGINLRGLNAEQVNVVLSDTADRLTKQEIDGFLIDDLECSSEPLVVEILLYLHSKCSRTDLLLLLTSSKPPSEEFLFSANLPASIGQQFQEFSEQDIREILIGLDVHHETRWAKYIHFLSGGGHPQLAIAAIQSMQNKGWDTSEFKTFKSLLVGNPAIERVRSRTRERLLNELPNGGRRILERLSLKSGSFGRGFALDMAQLPPAVSDAGILFDQLIGSWVDQQELDRFALSPLLSNYAVNTLTDEKKQEIYFEIANSLTKGRSLDPIEANSALIAAWSGKNTQVIVFICRAVLITDENTLKIIAPLLHMLTLMRTDTQAYKDNSTVSQIFRGAQLVLLCQVEEEPEQINEVLDRFEIESALVENEASKTCIALIVYMRILFSKSKFGSLPRFWNLVRKLDLLLNNLDEYLSPVQRRELIVREIDGVPTLSLLFFSQAQQIKMINDLLAMFEFLDSCGQELRQQILKLYEDPEFKVDMLVTGAWLSEDEANTINPNNHADVFVQLENSAKSWGHTDLAVCCRKYRAIIIDEYGGKKDRALVVIDEGLELYGKTNSELVRAKAKVLYRAENHQASLELSSGLINGDSPLSPIEKAFLSREAAISAEKQGDYVIARRYYLYGSNAAGNSGIPNMEPMRIGLMSDAALASWHAGDYETCLRDLVVVLQELENIDPKSSLRAAHCHAACRHIILWLDLFTNGEKQLLADGEEIKIYPGVVSNPEPHPEIGERIISPIGLAWYMLAALENNSCLDVGITQNIETLLPKGPILEGQFKLTVAKMRRAFTLLDMQIFCEALREIVAQFAYIEEQGGYLKSFKIENVGYETFPAPTLEQQVNMSNQTEQFVLGFVSNCVFTENLAGLDQLIDALEVGHGFKVRQDFLNALQGGSFVTDYNTHMAALLACHRQQENSSPGQVFELALRALQIASETNNLYVTAKYAYEWLNSKWTFISEHQRFLLTRLTFYEQSITEARTAEGVSPVDQLINLLQAILPVMGFKNENQLSQLLNDIR